MFRPKYEITNQINKYLAEIAVLREKILSLSILPKREVQLINKARLRMIHSSTAIEGNQLGIRGVEAVLKRRKTIRATEKDKKEVINYHEVMKFIDKQSKKEIKDWEKMILKIHQLITKDLLMKKESGRYRGGPVYVVEQISGKVVYSAPVANKVKLLMRQFGNWLDDQATDNISPVIVASIAHHQLVTIHPFVDGNGRVARALAMLVLYNKGYEINKTYALEDYYNLDRQAYYRAIQQARKKQSLTSFVEYFCQGFVIELASVLEKVEHLSIETRLNRKPIYLSSRQREILDFIAINGRVFRSDVVDIASVSEKTAYRELNSLKEMGILLRKGRGPSTYYIIKKGR